MSSLFPQMSTGAVAQFPLRSRSHYLTRVTDADDISETVYAAWTNPFGAWDLSVDAATDADVQIIQTFFESQMGRYGRFIFLDPMRNLLKYSNTFTNPAWTNTIDNTLTGIADPFGGTSAVQFANTSGVSESVIQGIAINATLPANAWFTASVWLQEASSGVLLRVTDNAAQTATLSVPFKSSWVRYEISKNFAASASGAIQFRVILPPSTVVNIYGAQLSYLPSAGDYDPTTSRNGVHPICRFDSDTLQWRHTGPGVSSIKFSVKEILS